MYVCMCECCWQSFSLVTVSNSSFLIRAPRDIVWFRLRLYSGWLMRCFEQRKVDSKLQVSNVTFPWKVSVGTRSFEFSLGSEQRKADSRLKAMHCEGGWTKGGLTPRGEGCILIVHGPRGVFHLEAEADIGTCDLHCFVMESSRRAGVQKPSFVLFRA